MSARAGIVAATLASSLLLAPAAARADVGDAPPAPPAPLPQYTPQVVVVPYPYTYPPAYYPPPAPPAPPAAEPQPRGFSMKMWAGPAYRRIYDIPISGGEFGLSFGAQKGFYGEMGVLLGRTDQGLFVFHLRPQATGELRLGPVRLGAGLGFAVVGIQRATTTSSMIGAGVGLTGFATVDLYASGGHALYLGGKMMLDWLPGGDSDSDALVWGPTAVLGWRY